MCQYSSKNGLPNDWHFVHLGSHAVGGAALVMTEATAVSPEGRISPDDAGIWSDKHAEAYQGITKFISSQKCVPGIQLAHAGRKASTYSPWKGKGKVEPEDGGWQTIAPSAIPFADNFPNPTEMTKEDIQVVINQFKMAAERSLQAGFKVIELHFAHGYLTHEFFSPLSNHRKDEYGGNLENRCRFAMEVTKAVREIVPRNLPLFVRISASDWVEDGWDIEGSVQLSKWLKEAGADLIDCSSGGNVPTAKIPVTPGYQVPFAEKIKKETGILTGAVGLITSPVQAESIIKNGQADIVLLGREMLRNPYWPLKAAKDSNVDVEWPVQYARAK
jgi:2,4-dienoyl-CoA reductase-like NADH-dependent reductase (Old Yellow Enzyme family)